jgi:hypothetical protein
MMIKLIIVDTDAAVAIVVAPACKQTIQQQQQKF